MLDYFSPSEVNPHWAHAEPAPHGEPVVSDEGFVGSANDGEHASSKGGLRPQVTGGGVVGTKACPLTNACLGPSGGRAPRLVPRSRYRGPRGRPIGLVPEGPRVAWGLVFVSAVFPVTIDRTGSSLILFGVQARGLPIWISLPIVFAVPGPALNRGHAGRREGLGQSVLTLRAPRTATGRAARPLGFVPGGGECSGATATLHWGRAAPDPVGVVRTVRLRRSSFARRMSGSRGSSGSTASRSRR
jgi:hypothetical protein